MSIDSAEPQRSDIEADCNESMTPLAVAPRERKYLEALVETYAKRRSTRPVGKPYASPRTPLELAPAAGPRQAPAEMSQYIQLNTAPIISYVISSTTVEERTCDIERAVAMEIL